MAGYAAIARTSETLVELLRDRIAARDDVVGVDRTEIALVSPDAVGADSDVRLSVFLYGVTENGALKNGEGAVGEDGASRDPPLALDLHYLLTALPATGGGDETAATVDQHRVLGLALQVLHDNAVLGADELPPELADTALHISFEQGDAERSMDTIRGIWHQFRDTTLQPSVTYTVHPVFVDSTVESPVTPTGDARMDYRSP